MRLSYTLDNNSVGGSGEFSYRQFTKATFDWRRNSGERIASFDIKGFLGLGLGDSVLK